MKRYDYLGILLFLSMFFISLFFSVKSYAQNNVSLQTYKLIREYKTNPTLFKSHNNNLSDNTYDTLKVFIDYDSSLSIEELEKYGKISLKTSNILIASIPVNNLETIADIPGVLRISIPEQLEPTLNEAIRLTNIEDIHRGWYLKQKYDGTGVIIGVPDYGFYLNHEMFKTKDGITRVKRAWVTQDTTGNPPEGYKGSLYTDSFLLANNNLFTTSKKEIHGTHVLGIAAGTEVQGKKASYGGVAPGADIVVVELEGSKMVTLPEIVDYIFKYADSVNKPVVINMSIGSTFHPGDGTSSAEILINNLIEQNPHGRIIVAAAGNKGDVNMHLEHTFERDTLSFSIYGRGTNPNWGCLKIWGDEDNNFKLMVVIRDLDNLNDTVSVYKSGWYSTNESENKEEQINDDITLYFRTDSSYIYNNKPYIEFYAGELNSNQIITVYIVSEDAHIHIWNSNAGYIYNENMTKLLGDTKYTIDSPGIMNNVITVGATVMRDQIENIEGNVYNVGAGNVLNIAYYSSRGPSTNGEIKPDIVAPGSVIYSAFNNDFDFNAENTARIFRNIVDKTENGDYFYAAQGTSMSTPFITGLVALMLQINPKLTQSEIKDIFRITALNDALTGDAKINKSNRWGWGKINPLAIMRILENSSVCDQTKETSKIHIKSTLPIMNNKINILYDNKSINNMPSLVQIFDINGNLVYLSSINMEKEFDISNLSNGSYFIKIDDSTKSFIISR